MVVMGRDYIKVHSVLCQALVNVRGNYNRVKVGSAALIKSGPDARKGAGLRLLYLNLQIRRRSYLLEHLVYLVLLRHT